MVKVQYFTLNVLKIIEMVSFVIYVTSIMFENRPLVSRNSPSGAFMSFRNGSNISQSWL